MLSFPLSKRIPPSRFRSCSKRSSSPLNSSLFSSFHERMCSTWKPVFAPVFVTRSSMGCFGFKFMFSARNPFLCVSLHETKTKVQVQSVSLYLPQILPHRLGSHFVSSHFVDDSLRHRSAARAELARLKVSDLDSQRTAFTKAARVGMSCLVPDCSKPCASTGRTLA